MEYGAKVRFVPAYFESKVLTVVERRALSIKGTVIYINERNKYFVAEYDCGNTKQREAFNFCDIGKAVKMLG